MERTEVDDFVRQCLDALKLGLGWERAPVRRPPSIIGVYRTPAGQGRAACFVMTTRATYRFVFWTLVTPAGKQLVTESVWAHESGFVREISYWEMPPMIRDLGITAGQLQLGIQDIPPAAPCR